MIKCNSEKNVNITFIFIIFFYRFFETATLIKKNLRVFMAACEHVDVITTIIDYFIHFAVSFKLDNGSGMYNNIANTILGIY